MKTKNFTLLLSIIFIVSFHFQSNAQAPPILSQKCLGGNLSDIPLSSLANPDGSITSIGYTYSNTGDVTGNHGLGDVWVTHQDGDGDLIWQKALGGSADDIGYAISLSDDGSYGLVATSSSNNGDVSGNHGFSDLWVAKLDASGNLIWQKSLGSSAFDEGRAIAATSDGGYIVVGDANANDGDVSGYHGSTDIWVAKLDADGNLSWQKCLGGSSFDRGYSVQVTSEGYIVGGTSSSVDGEITGNNGSGDAWVVKLDESGSVLWQQSIGGTLGDNLTHLENTSDGGYIFSGYTSSNDGDVSGLHGGCDEWLVKLDGSGTVEWSKCYGSTDNDFGTWVEQTNDGGYLMAGRVDGNDGDVSGNHGRTDGWVIKCNSLGTLSWQLCLGGTKMDLASSINVGASGDYFVVSDVLSNNGDVSGKHGSDDFWVVKLQGETASCITPPGEFSSNLTSTSAKVNWSGVGVANKYKVRYRTTGNAVWTNTSSTNTYKKLKNLASATQYDWQVKSVCTDAGLGNSEWSATQNFTTLSLRLSDENVVVNDLEIFPNPVSSSSIIEFTLNQPSLVSVKLFTVDGKEVMTIVNENFAEGNHQVTLNRQSLTPGIYFLQLQTNEGLITKKVIIE